MIELHIDETVKGYSAKERWSLMNQKVEYFPTLIEAKQWINKTYKKHRRHPIRFSNVENGDIKKVGYIVGFHNDDISHYPVVKWLQRDWITFHESKLLFFK